MLLRDDETSDFDFIEYIVIWLNEVESESKKYNYSSDEKLDYVLAKLQLIMSPYEYAKNEKLFIIVINGLVKMGNGEYKVKTNPHKNEACCCNCCTIL